MKPWRDIAVPHANVLSGAIKQSEFAADLTAVHSGKAPEEYQDARKFFERTYITEGMGRLLVQVAERLAGRGGEPVVQLQTAFGGGKTHTMLAVLHLATRTCELSALAGVPALLDRAGLGDVPQSRVAVLDGQKRGPATPWKEGRTKLNTLWGELAWQLGRADGFALVAEADATGTSPGKEVLRQLLEKYAPCVVLIDELVAYVRQFTPGSTLTGGTFDSNLSFVQALTEAAKLVPNAVVLASLPESEVEAGGAQGVPAMKALEKVFGRVQAIWKPIATEESFEIVRRRLFEPIRDLAARDAVCRAFADAYRAEGAKLPSETQEGRYAERLAQAYPIHPEVFDRLYEDWATIDGFQRTRGVLKLMAKVIARLWKAGNADLLILPGSLPLADTEVRTELVNLLPTGWDSVVERDIDGDRAETTELEARETRFGPTQAARRVARTLFLGTAPASATLAPGQNRGMDRGRVLLGCLQPGQSPAVYTDALNKLADKLHYLTAAGDKSADATRYWFDTRPNLRREMETRKQRFDAKSDVRKAIEAAVQKLFPAASPFGGVHVFTPHADVPDDSTLRLVVLPPEQPFTKENPKAATDAVLEYLRLHGAQPRHRANRLLFVAADEAVLSRLRDMTRVSLAWASIVEDVAEGRLNADTHQQRQAAKEAKAAAEVVPRAARECFRWLLCPTQDDPRVPAPEVESHLLNTSSGTAAAEAERVCRENELVIDAWSPMHLRTELQKLYWKADRPAVKATVYWDDSQKYLYLPRLKSREVLAAAVRKGAAEREFFGTAYGEAGGKYEGFHLGDGDPTLDDSLLLIEPAAAREYSIAQKKLIDVQPPEPGTATRGRVTPDAAKPDNDREPVPPPVTPPSAAKAFRGSVEVSAALAKSRLAQIADEVIAHLNSDPGATIRVTLEVDAQFPDGVRDATRRAVSENARTLNFKLNEWE